MTKISKPRWRRNYAVLSPSTSDKSLLSIDQELVQEAYKSYGALLFRGFDLDTESFRQLTSQYCTHAVFNESPGRETVDAGSVIQTVNKGEEPFPLHPELSREPWKPDVCWFGCLTPPASQGQTTICDGTKIVRKLPKNMLEELTNSRLRYRRLTSPEEVQYWLKGDDLSDAALQAPPEDCPFTFERHNGNLFRSFSAPMLHKTMFSKELCFGNFLLFNRFLNNDFSYPTYEDGTLVPRKLTNVIKIVGDACLVAVKWQAGDVLMLDNTRFMHGRRGIRDASQRRILTYFGFLNFAVPCEQEGPNPRWRDPEIWRNIQMELEEAA